MEIKQSFDYEKFKTISGNRRLNEKKIKNIISDIKSGLNLLPYCPIIIYDDNDSFLIIDGQHRKEVSRRLGEPVYYVESEKLNLRQIARINSRSDKWTNKNFLECYVNIGIEDYVILSNFLNKYNIVYSAAISFLMVGKVSDGGADTMEIFRNGDFKVKFFDRADIITSLTLDLFEKYNFSRDRALISAIDAISEKGLCDFKVLKAKINVAPNEMDKQWTKKAYIFNIERVYNYNNRNRIPIF